MPGAVCKTVICANKAVKELEAAIKTIEDIRNSNETDELKIELFEMFLKYGQKANKASLMITA
jgi:hypothetical protein